jgi:hypothetical protein
VHSHVDAAARLALLATERKDRRLDLAKMPMTRSLINDEIRRLTPYAERLKRAGSKVFLEIIVVKKKG